MQTPQAGWIPVHVGDAYALRQFIKLVAQHKECPIPEGQRQRVLALLYRIEGVEDSAIDQQPPMSDIWGLAN